MCVLSCFSRVQLCVTLWSVTRQAPLSMGFSRQEYWSELPSPSPGDLPDPGIELRSPVCPALQAVLYPLSHRRSPQSNCESESEVAQSCPTLCDPVNCSPPGSSILGILQARILEWVAISFSKGTSRPRDRTQVSRTAGRRFNL